jgi:hypothetical protein
MRRFYLPAAAMLWAADLSAATTGPQGALEDGGRAFRQALRWPTEMAREYWYFIVGAVVLVLVLRSYLRK